MKRLIKEKKPDTHAKVGVLILSARRNMCAIRKPVAADPPQNTISLFLLFSQRGKALPDVTPPFPIQSSPNHLVKPIDVDPDPGGKKLPERRRTFCHSNQSKVT